MENFDRQLELQLEPKAISVAPFPVNESNIIRLQFGVKQPVAQVVTNKADDVYVEHILYNAQKLKW